MPQPVLQNTRTLLQILQSLCHYFTITNNFGGFGNDKGILAVWSRAYVNKISHFILLYRFTVLL